MYLLDKVYRSLTLGILRRWFLLLRYLFKQAQWVRGNGGDVFILAMGDPIKITALARKMIRLSSLTEITKTEPNGNIEIQFTGLRPGKELYEELLIGEDVKGSEHPRIMTTNEVHLT
jgi:FlaA1/EpsC-like NDP-sugar epimerase